MQLCWLELWQLYFGEGVVSGVRVLAVCVALQTHLKRSSNAPQTHLKRSSNAPQTHLKRASNAPQTHLKRSSNAPQTHLKRTSNAPQTHLKRTSKAPQTLKKLKKNNLEKVGLYMLIYFHIPPYTSIYLHIALYTFIYRHIHQNIEYFNAYGGIWRYIGYLKLFEGILWYMKVYKHI